MTMTACETFEKGTATFNAHDLDGFAEVLADEVVFKAPGGAHGKGKAACAAFFGRWFAAFPDAHVEVHAVHIVGPHTRRRLLQTLPPLPVRLHLDIRCAWFRFPPARHVGNGSVPRSSKAR